MSDIVRRGRQELTPQEAVDFVLSLGDPNMIAQVYNQAGWTLTEEARELLKVARQDGNAAAKLQAIKMLRQMIRDAAEAGGLIAGVTRTIPGAEGSTTVFHAQRIAEALNPVTRKPIESTQIDEETEDDEADGPDYGCTGAPGTRTGTSAECGTGDDASPAADDRDRIAGVDTGCADEVRGLADGDRGQPDQPAPEADEPCGGDSCVQHAPPICDRELYPGVTGKPKTPGV